MICCIFGVHSLINVSLTHFLLQSQGNKLPLRSMHAILMASGYMFHIYVSCAINTLRPRQNGPHFSDDIFKRIFLNGNWYILMKISFKFFPQGPINNIPALVQIMALRRPGDKPLSEPVMVNCMMNLCVTQFQWVKKLKILIIVYLKVYMTAIFKCIIWWC